MAKNTGLKILGFGILAGIIIGIMRSSNTTPKPKKENIIPTRSGDNGLAPVSAHSTSME